MPSLTFEYLEKNMPIDYSCFVETGTYKGRTILGMEKHFEELHTIELKLEFYEDAKKLSDKINFHHGDSSKKLNELCPKLDKDTIFFLDGHWSAGNTAKGDKDCPIYEELECIMKKFKHTCCIIIDDVRLFGRSPYDYNNFDITDWKDITREKVLHIVNDRLINHYYRESELDPEDRLFLFLD